MSQELRTFMEMMFHDKPSDLFLLVWSLQDKSSQWLQNVDDAIAFIETCADTDVYVGVGLSVKDMGPHQRCRAADVIGIVGLWADIDLRSDAHPNASLPDSVEAGRHILPENLPPTFLVDTGNGLHAWWKFKEPMLFEHDDDRLAAVTLSERWQTFLKYRAADKGYAFDRLADLARVLRIPGTFNHKNPQKPKPVRIIEESGRQYDPSDLEDYMDSLSIPEHQTSTIEFLSEGDEFDIRLDPNAAIPTEAIESHRQQDIKFRNTWDRQRHDLKDQSQSGYDLALANFGAQAGFSDQQIVDLIIHHRRNHGERPRKEIDYFRRTIRKARKVAQAEQELLAATVIVPALAEDPDSAVAGVQRAALCHQISQTVGVEIIRILKVKAKDPVYQIELPGHRVEFSGLGRLINQQTFRTTIGAAINALPNKVPAKAWESVTKFMVRAATEIDGGDEADFAGRTRLLIERYLAENEPLAHEDVMQPHLARKPVVIEGQVTICGDDLRAHILRTGSEAIPPAQMASMLIALGACSKRFKCGSLRDQSRWVLPAELFAPETFQQHELGASGSEF